MQTFADILNAERFTSLEANEHGEPHYRAQDRGRPHHQTGQHSPAGGAVRTSRTRGAGPHAQTARKGVSERLLASLELGDAPGIRLDKLLAVYDALGLELFTIGEHIREERPWEHNESSAASDSTDTAPATRTTAQRRRRGARVTARTKRTESSPELRLSDFQSAYDKLIADIFHDNSEVTAR